MVAVVIVRLLVVVVVLLLLLMMMMIMSGGVDLPRVVCLPFARPLLTRWWRRCPAPVAMTGPSQPPLPSSSRCCAVDCGPGLRRCRTPTATCRTPPRGRPWSRGSSWRRCWHGTRSGARWRAVAAGQVQQAQVPNCFHTRVFD